MNRDLEIRGSLPQLPVLMYPIVGMGIIEECLIAVDKYPTPEIAMVAYRNSNSAERMRYRRCYWVEDKGKQAIIHYVPFFGEGRSDIIAGKTINDLAAIKILIGNQLAGHSLSSIRWEIYEDSNCEELIDIGRFDQWDLLKDIRKPKQLRLLENKGIVPCGNWDFDKLLWERKCSVCGSVVSINSHFYNIDSAVCMGCGNRPFLAPSVHQLLDSYEKMGLAGDSSLHVLKWISGVGAKFEQVRRDSSDEQGRLIKSVWQKTLMAKAIESGSEMQVKNLMETNTNLDFSMYKSCCTKMQKALSGEEHFSAEHQIAIDFVLKATELLQIRQLTTK